MHCLSCYLLMSLAKAICPEPLLKRDSITIVAYNQ